MRALAGLPVLVLDAQATCADPTRGTLLEIGWAGFSAGEAGHLPLAEVTAHVVAPPSRAVVPPAVARLTGLGTEEWASGIAPALAWELLQQEAARVAAPPGPVPVVIHFVRFEEPFLRALHLRHGTGPFPFDIVCTHAIACRLLPELPRRTLRALAGYFGAGVPSLRRSAHHVVATAFVWRHLVASLAEREGIVGLADLHEWLKRPASRAPRRWPLPRERRRTLPDRPGVYRLSRAGGAVLYVGKAASLRSRVSGHFHTRAGQGERALEMLTQVREVSCSETETALEAALQEADEIKRLAPPYNVALAPAGRTVWFATADLRGLQQRPDGRHPVGPFYSPAPVEALSALRDVLTLGEPASASLVARARAVGVERTYAPRADCFAAGFARFLSEHGSPSSVRGLLRLGARLWAIRRAEVASGPDHPAEEEPRRLRRPAWDEERVRQALEETVLRAAHALRRARWLCRLSECSLAWAEPEVHRLRLLVIRGGAVEVRTHIEPGTPLPIPPGHARPPAERRASFDVGTFDRLRVLSTELKRLAADAESVELRLGRHARLSRRRLQAVLRWL